MNTITMSNESNHHTQLVEVLYTGKTHTTGGRDTASRSSDGRLDIQLSSPGTPGSGTNPEVHGRWEEKADDERCIGWARVFPSLPPYASDGAHVNFMTEEESDRVAAADGANYDRLAEIKKTVRSRQSLSSQPETSNRRLDRDSQTTISVRPHQAARA